MEQDTPVQPGSQVACAVKVCHVSIILLNILKGFHFSFCVYVYLCICILEG